MALRVDMDANDLVESANEKHRPFREGFASVNKGAMHACGHDMHMTTVIGAGRVMARLRDQWTGTLVLIGRKGAERRLNAPGPKAIISWLGRNHGIEVLVRDLA